MRVYQAYIQYVAIELEGAAIQRHRVEIPNEIVESDDRKDPEERMRTTFDLFEKNDELSSKKMEEKLRKIRKNFTKTLGKKERVVLKKAKPRLEKRLQELRDELEAHQRKVAADLERKLDDSRKRIIEYYAKMVQQNPPDSLCATSPHPETTLEDAQRWIEWKLSPVFPKKDVLMRRMQLNVHYKEMTFETLNEPDFRQKIKEAYPDVDWDKPYDEFRAAGEVQK